MTRLRQLKRRVLLRLIGSLPPWLARRSSRLAALLLRDAGRTRHSSGSLALALSLITDVNEPVAAADELLTIAEIARRVHRRAEEVADWSARGLLGAVATPGPPPRWAHGPERARLVGYLLHSGQSLEAVEAAEREGRLPLVVIERAIAGRGQLTIEEVAARAEIGVDFAERVMHALGASRGDPGERVFGRRDVRALRIVRAMTTLLGEDEVLDVVAVIGRAMAQIAASEVEAFRRRVAEPFVAAGIGELELALRSAALVDLLVPTAGVLLNQAHRRVLEASIRAESVVRLEAAGSLPSQELVTVGFADIVGYTLASERLSPLQLGEMGRGCCAPPRGASPPTATAS